MGLFQNKNYILVGVFYVNTVITKQNGFYRYSEGTCLKLVLGKMWISYNALLEITYV